MASAPAADAPSATVKAAVHVASSTDNWRNVGYLGSDWLLIVAAAAAHHLWSTRPLYLLTVLVIGTRLRALGNLLHEAAHFKLFSPRSVNHMVGRLLCSWPILVGYRRYTAEHRLHHAHLWDADRDPDMALYTSTTTEFRSVERISYFRFLLRHVLLVIVPIEPLWRLARERKLLRVAVSAVAVGVLMLLVPPLGRVLLLYWLIPFLTTHQMITYWAELAEHGGLRDSGAAWGTRNWTGSALTRWAIGSHSDDPFHLLHHRFPSVPHYRLNDVDAVCRTHWPAYAAQDRCSGFFIGHGGRASVMRDIWLGGTGRASPPSCSPEAATHDSAR